MSLWRPSGQIRVKALGLHWRGDSLLAAEVRNDNGSIKGVRPLGGGVEFGEQARDALLREFREELGLDVSVRGEPFVMENHFDHEGAKGHEVLFIYEVGFPAGVFDGQNHIIFYEDDGAECVARWFALDALDVDGGLDLFPKALKPFLIARRSRAASTS